MRKQAPTGFNQNNSFGHELFLSNLSEIVVGEEAVLLPFDHPVVVVESVTNRPVLPPSHYVYCLPKNKFF